MGRAESDRRVGLRPAPDTMTFLTGFLPVAQGVTVHTALRRHAESLRGRATRGIGQIMAGHPGPPGAGRQRGGTTGDNGQGQCEHCNYVKEAPGWTASVARTP